jgi:hypothetical protein
LTPTTSSQWQRKEIDYLANPDSRSWNDLKRGVEFTPEVRAEIDAGTQRLIAEARAFRLAEVRLVHRSCSFLF